MAYSRAENRLDGENKQGDLEQFDDDEFGKYIHDWSLQFYIMEMSLWWTRGVDALLPFGLFTGSARKSYDESYQHIIDKIAKECVRRFNGTETANLFFESLGLWGVRYKKRIIDKMNELSFGSSE